MKYLLRYCCVLFAVLLCLGAFSVGVSAAAVDVPAYSITQRFDMKHGDAYVDGAFHQFTPNNGQQEQNWWHSEEFTALYPINCVNTFGVYPETEDGILIPAGGSVTITFNQFFTEFIYKLNGETKYLYEVDECRILLFYHDGTLEYVDDVAQSVYNYTITFTPKKSVSSVELILKKNFTPSVGSTVRVGSSMGEIRGDNAHEFLLNVESEEVGLLKGIIEWFKKLWNSIVEIPTKVFESFKGALDGISNWISSAVDAIVELPSKIWSFIEEGLKSLFVPDDEFIAGYKDDFDNLLSEKFGAVYQIVDITFGSLERIQNADEMNSIELPETTINLPENSSFSFGGYTVKIVPDGFEPIVNVLKTLVGIVCTVLFINGLRSRYDELMGVER